ncbi:uncharacterized protein [Prorops nasuta]|uniref:uncharacterized protein n=1 Tax=Prorops nasuta TaxID=863751 RepID=UPI0034CDDCC9
MNKTPPKRQESTTMASSSNTTLLKRDRATIKGQLTRALKAFSNISSPNEQQEEIEARLQKVTDIWDLFNITQSKIEASEGQGEQVEEREAFETMYFKTISTGKRLLNTTVGNRDNTSRMPSPPHTCEENGNTMISNIRLPTLNLPMFDGSYAQWLPFRDTFQALINENIALNNIQKFYYLKSSLREAAGQIIHSLEMSAENYEIAWDLLKSRYENKRLLIHHHIQALFTLTAISKESAVQLRKLLDEVNKHLRSLNTLGQPTQHWDSLIIHMITTKLDVSTRRKWESSITNQEAPVLKQLMELLTQRCFMLETIQSTRTTTTNNTASSTKRTERTVGNVGISSSKKCHHCQGNHAMYSCDNFKKLTTQEKWVLVKQLKLCFNCLRPNHTTEKCTSTSCICDKKHNTLLHIKEFTPRTEPSHANEPTMATVEVESPVALSNCQGEGQVQVVLGTALVKIVDKNGNLRVCRALLDSGSQSNLITKKLCQQLGLVRQKRDIFIAGISLARSHVSESVTATIRSRVNAFSVKLPFLVMDQITEQLPSSKAKLHLLEIPQDLNLADPSFHVPGTIDLLLGAGIFYSLLCVGQRIASRRSPILQNTKLGWIIAGAFSTTNNQHEIDKGTVMACTITNETIHDQLERFWQLEHLPERKKLSNDEQQCEMDFVNNYRRDPHGRFIVKLSFKDNVSELGDSREIAERRLRSTLRRLEKHSDLRNSYNQFMQEYSRLGHMTEIPNPAEHLKTPIYYLPHHAVTNQSSSSTKVRVVFDASCKSTSGKSLNDILRVGPTIQQDLFSIILRFRQHQYALTADIQKMYRQINVAEEHRDLQRILWLDDKDGTIREYKLNTVTYGTATAPFLATRCLQQLAQECSTQEPSISKVIQEDFYVDDLLTGGDDVTTIECMKVKITQILLQGQFPLHKWSSNVSDITRNVEDDPDRPVGEQVKTLGLFWSHSNDTFSYKTATPEPNIKITKRLILSTLAQMFDPLGLMGPVCIKAKLMLQDLWRLRAGWDESLPNNIHTAWVEYAAQLKDINTININRKVVCANAHVIDLHGFCDASEAAYGACIFVRSVNQIFDSPASSTGR